MSANVESMFYVRETPWHGLGVNVEETLCSRDALREAGLNWNVIQQPIHTEGGICISGYQANVRTKDKNILGVVSDRYKVVQNNEAFAFTDGLIGEGVKYETAGSLHNGRKVWLLARLPEKYIIAGDEVFPYLLFSNSHDGSGAIKVAMTPIRVVCQNTLNLALDRAKRVWATIHTGNVQTKLDEAKKTLLLAEYYMSNLEKEVESLTRMKLADAKVLEYINLLIPAPDGITDIQRRNIVNLRTNLRIRYFEAPDLAGLPRDGWRFINAVSDFATHSEPLRKTSSYKEKLFARTIEGNPIIDRAYEILKTAA